MAAAVGHLERDAAKLGVSIDRKALQCALLATDDGRDLRNDSDDVSDKDDNESKSESLLATLLHLTLSRGLNWPKAMLGIAQKFAVTHVVDFGPGEASGAGSLMQKLVDGDGIIVIVAGTATDKPKKKTKLVLVNSSQVLYLCHLFCH